MKAVLLLAKSLATDHTSNTEPCIADSMIFIVISCSQIARDRSDRQLNMDPMAISYRVNVKPILIRFFFAIWGAYVVLIMANTDHVCDAIFSAAATITLVCPADQYVVATKRDMQVMWTVPSVQGSSVTPVALHASGTKTRLTFLTFNPRGIKFVLIKYQKILKFYIILQTKMVQVVPVLLKAMTLLPAKWMSITRQSTGPGRQ